MVLTRPAVGLLLFILIVTTMLVESKKGGGGGGRRKCKTPTTCKKLGGVCQTKDCGTIMIKDGGCEGTCECCAKINKKCKPKRTCKKAEGFCVKSTKSCPDGEIIYDACKCKKKKKGVCCVPPKPTWSYDLLFNAKDGPFKWWVNWPTCGGHRQSPININTTQAKKLSQKGFWGPVAEVEVVPPFEFTLYDKKPTKIYLKNNGKLLSMVWKAPAKPFVSGGGLDEAYILDHLQFHWYTEHFFDGEHYDLEMQLYHYNANYGSMEKALQEEDGVAALAVIFHRCEENNTALAEILDQMDGELLPGPDNGMVEMLYSQPLSAFLPEDTSKYYRYMGSMTQPACEEAVIWTIFNTTVNVSQYQLDQLRRLRDSNNGPMQDNYRPVQQLWDREVYYSAGEDLQPEPEPKP